MEHSVNPEHYVFRSDTAAEYQGEDMAWPREGRPAGNDRYFSRLVATNEESSDSPLQFRVENQPDKRTYEVCYCPLHPTDRGCFEQPRDCHPLEVGVRETSGLLYVVLPKPKRGSPSRMYHYLKDFTTQRVEVSVASSQTKVYRDILVEPPDSVPDCSDYPDKDIDRYMCLFQGETLPPKPTQDEALLGALPSQLVQATENYELIFAEEFNGVDGGRPGTVCAGGLSNLDSTKWNYSDDWCRGVDAEGTPCLGMDSGHYSMAVTATCGGGISTRGKFAYKYGYLETKYTVNLDESYEQVLAFVIGENNRRPLKYANEKYGVTVRDNEDITRYLAVEIDLFEYLPEVQREIAHRYINYLPYIRYRHSTPRSTAKWSRFCDHTDDSEDQLDFLSSEDCEGMTEITVTKGLEWTPRGYRMLMKVDGVHDDFIVVHKESTKVRTYSTLTLDEPVEFGTHINYYGIERDRFFEFADEADPDTVIEKVGVSHTPLNIWLSAWSGFRGPFGEGEDTIITKLRLDYVRVLQPLNRYAGMEPVFK